MGNARFLRKPYSRGALLGEVGRMLAGQRVGDGTIPVLS